MDFDHSGPPLIDPLDGVSTANNWVTRITTLLGSPKLANSIAPYPQRVSLRADYQGDRKDDERRIDPSYHPHFQRKPILKEAYRCRCQSFRVKITASFRSHRTSRLIEPIS